MKLIVISPADDDSREPTVLAALFAAGLECYHVRKPAWSREKLEAWLNALPEAWRQRLVLHQHHECVTKFGLGGRHWRDDGTAPSKPLVPTTHPEGLSRQPLASRSCHDLPALRAALGSYDSVLVGPLFSSISKPGHGPNRALPEPALRELLRQRSGAQRRTAVFALGGVAAGNLPHCRDLGVDGVAVLGAIWQAADPLRVFAGLQDSPCCHAA
jgi:thiamine-phosphate pyrophosphorylase